MDQEVEDCQDYYRDLICITDPDRRKYLSLRKYGWRLKRYFWWLRVLGPFQFTDRFLFFNFFPKHAQKKIKGDIKVTASSNHSKLQPGDIVEVLSEREIFSTLDHDGKLNGLRFIPEMRKYCGKKFKILKKLDKIIIETTSELRTIKTPTFILEGVVCDGKAHGGCDRLCFCFWRKTWLKEVNNQT
jgi:hypothetical protein